MPKVFGKQIGQVTRAPSRAGTSSPKVKGKKFNTLLDRGTKQVRRGGNHKTATPKAFGNGKQFTNYPNNSRRKGGGANKGAGDTTGFDV